MKALTSQSDLAGLLKSVSRAISSKPSHPILAGIYFIASDDKLTATAYDLELGIISSIPASVQSNGSTVVPYRTLADIISRMDPFAAIQLTVEGNQFKLTSTNGSYSLACDDPTDYPELPIVNAIGESVDLTPLSAVLPSASTDPSKQILCGVHFICTDDHLQLEATDGHRLSVISTPFTIPLDVVIPIKCLTLAKQPSLTIAVDKAHVAFNINDTTIISRILEGEFPAVQSLIPPTFSHTATINRSQLLSAIERIAVIGHDVVKLNASASQLNITAEFDANSGIESIPIAGTLPPLGLNPNYLADGLRAFSSDTITISANTSTSPITLTNPDVTSQTYLIMPIQIRT
jgi:DNA polymerase-3 subunit beta